MHLLGTRRIYGYNDLEKVLKARGSLDGFTIMPIVAISSHLQIKKGSQDRTRVRPAAELMSTTVADGIILLFPNDLHMKNLSSILRKIDDWFDVFNSHGKIKKQLKLAKKPFGAIGAFEHQTKILKDFDQLIRNIRVGKRETLMQWQKNCLWSTKALPLMFDELKENYSDFKFILTCRILQDALGEFHLSIFTSSILILLCIEIKKCF